MLSDTATAGVVEADVNAAAAAAEQGEAQTAATRINRRTARKHPSRRAAKAVADPAANAAALGQATLAADHRPRSAAVATETGVPRSAADAAAIDPAADGATAHPQALPATTHRPSLWMDEVPLFFADQGGIAGFAVLCQHCRSLLLPCEACEALLAITTDARDPAANRTCANLHTPPLVLPHTSMQDTGWMRGCPFKPLAIQAGLFALVFGLARSLTCAGCGFLNVMDAEWRRAAGLEEVGIWPWSAKDLLERQMEHLCNDYVRWKMQQYVKLGKLMKEKKSRLLHARKKAVPSPPRKKTVTILGSGANSTRPGDNGSRSAENAHIRRARRLRINPVPPGVDTRKDAVDTDRICGARWKGKAPAGVEPAELTQGATAVPTATAGDVNMDSGAEASDGEGGESAVAVPDPQAATTCGTDPHANGDPTAGGSSVIGGKRKRETAAVDGADEASVTAEANGAAAAASAKRQRTDDEGDGEAPPAEGWRKTRRGKRGGRSRSAARQADPAEGDAVNSDGKDKSGGVAPASEPVPFRHRRRARAPAASRAQLRNRGTQTSRTAVENDPAPLQPNDTGPKRLHGPKTWEQLVVHLSFEQLEAWEWSIREQLIMIRDRTAIPRLRLANRDFLGERDNKVEEMDLLRLTVLQSLYSGESERDQSIARLARSYLPRSMLDSAGITASQNGDQDAKSSTRSLSLRRTKVVLRAATAALTTTAEQRGAPAPSKFLLAALAGCAARATAATTAATARAVRETRWLRGELLQAWREVVDSADDDGNEGESFGRDGDECGRDARRGEEGREQRLRVLRVRVAGLVGLYKAWVRDMFLF